MIPNEKGKKALPPATLRTRRKNTAARNDSTAKQAVENFWAKRGK